ncbi:flavin reductase family protein [Nocardia transvalensis]|uniref:flavin reductase family protein n=1 Tax=Nocardia transvalensis TaxID=37333 RepID=UPI001895A681|nr:flavin reductase family protein [Nocardia transvalensis]MBF6328261.1 flavin reductase family protein [Nocardia transvalensis]
MTITPASFRALFGSFPTAVAVVTAAGENGAPKGLTCTAIAAVSADPPHLLVCIDELSSTRCALERSGGFAVNFLAEGGEQISDRFAGRGDRKFDGLKWSPSGVAFGAPVLEDYVLGTAECVVVRQIRSGDHHVFIGRLEAAHVHRRRPLLHHRRVYSVWDQLAELPSHS